MAQTTPNEQGAAEESGKEGVAQPERNIGFKPSEGAIFEARVAEADADYSIAKEICDDKTGNVKNDCVKEAKATAVATKADAKLRMKTANAQKKVAKKSAKANSKANE
ncbi:MAG: hypothetical protein PHQ05_07940 [Sterolibacterium sp.]|nr:hypothetical protein [Sterolibacterium sp.]